jgi:glycosyltransferase involved in cell wall biosynthesis
MYSVVIPVYRNAEFVPLLIAEFRKISEVTQSRYGVPAEFIFVVDHSPDDSYQLLERALPSAPFRSQLVLHSRNFGSFAAIRTGLTVAEGEYFAVIAADLQEPPQILLSFLQVLVADECDIAVGVRTQREDPAVSRAAANIFWRLYRYFVMKEIPEGGVDIFGCNRRVRDELLKLRESHSSIVGLIFWLGFRRVQIDYTRQRRQYGKSAWTFAKKLTYLLDSVFAFTDLPVRILTFLGAFGTAFALIFAILILALRLLGDIAVPGYAATVVTIMFFGALNTFGLGLVGSYAWRGYENTKGRPLSVIQSRETFSGLNRTDHSEQDISDHERNA